MIDKTFPEGDWKFDKQVAQVFEDMLGRSIPGHEWMRESIAIFLKTYFPDKQLDILDVGCSDGQAYKSLTEFGIKISTYIGLDSSLPMLEKARAKHPQEECEWVNWDICSAQTFPSFSDNFDVALAIFTIQFVPMEYRPKILKKIYKNLRVGGVLLFLEKVTLSSVIAQESIVSSYHAMKHKNGYSLESIEQKRMSLENILIAQTELANEQMLRDAGFTVQRFWHAFNFCGWVAFKTNED